MSVPNQFTNGLPADADEVNENFTDLDARLAAEATARAAADTALDGRVDALEATPAEVTQAELDAEASARTAAIATHAADTTSVHGIPDTTVLATDAEVAAAVAAETAARNTALGLKQSTSEKGQASGYAALDASGRVLDGSGVPVESTVVAGALAERRAERGREQVITNFATGHGFTQSGVGTITDDTTTYARGGQSLKMTTDGANGILRATKSTISPALDFVGRTIRVFLKIDRPDRLDELWLYLSSSTGMTANWITKEITQDWGAGQGWHLADDWAVVEFAWGDSGSSGTPDRSAIQSLQLRARDDGSGPVNIWVGGITTLPEQPQGVVSFTFDDGFDSVFTKARKKMDDYGFQGTAYIIADRIGASGSFMTEDKLRLLQDINGWEIGSHAFTVANHDLGLAALDDATVEAEFYGIRKWLLDRGLTGGEHIAYPKTQFDIETLRLARQYFTSARTVLWDYELPLPPDPLRLRARQVASTTTTAAVAAWVTHALQHREWLILNFHKIADTNPGADGNTYLTADFATVVDNVASQGLAVRTVGDVIRNGAI